MTGPIPPIKFQPKKVPNQAKGGELSRPAKFAKSIYLSAAALGGLYVAASVVSSLWLKHPSGPAGIEARASASVDVLGCHDQVVDLLDVLGETTAELVGKRTEAQGAVSTQWATFTAHWQERVRAVDRQCRFTELTDSGAGVHYDRIAHVYERLPSAFLRYDNLVRRYDNQQTSELISMRRALEKSRKALERRSE